MSPVVTRVRNDKWLTIALDSRKLDASSIKMGPFVPIVEEQLKQKSTGIMTLQNQPKLISRTDLEFVHGQL